MMSGVGRVDVGVRDGVGFGFGFGGGLGADELVAFGAPASGMVNGGAPASTGAAGGGFLAGFHASVEWHVSHVVEKSACPGNRERPRSSS
jgi:hypothetical protein